jgi:hypothetical protein
MSTTHERQFCDHWYELIYHTIEHVKSPSRRDELVTAAVKMRERMRKLEQEIEREYYPLRLVR